MLHPRLQDQHGRHLIHDLPAPLNRHIGFTQQPVCLGRGQPLIPQMYRNPNSFPQLLGEALHLLRLDPFLAAHPQREPHHDLGHLVLSNQVRQCLEVLSLVFPLQRLQALRRDAQRIRNRDANSLRADIQPENSPHLRIPCLAQRWRHSAIICCAEIARFDYDNVAWRKSSKSCPCVPPRPSATGRTSSSPWASCSPFATWPNWFSSSPWFRCSWPLSSPPSSISSAASGCLAACPL